MTMTGSTVTDRDRIERLDLLLEDLQRGCAMSAAESERRTRTVARLTRILGTLMGMLALSNLYFVNDLTQEVRLVVAQMDEMTGYFVRVSERMHAMRQEIADMEADVRLLPVIDAQVAEIADHVDAMGMGVAAMERSTAVMDAEIGGMRHALGDMAVRFRRLNSSVGTMGVDVREMAKPLR
jgi:hypothetical protein